VGVPVGRLSVSVSVANGVWHSGVEMGHGRSCEQGDGVDWSRSEVAGELKV
jgi:hypothetical protein